MALSARRHVVGRACSRIDIPLGARGPVPGRGLLPAVLLPIMPVIGSYPVLKTSGRGPRQVLRGVTACDDGLALKARERLDSPLVVDFGGKRRDIGMQPMGLGEEEPICPLNPRTKLQLVSSD